MTSARPTAAQWQWGTGKVKASEKPPSDAVRPSVHAVRDGGTDADGRLEEVFLPGLGERKACSRCGLRVPICWG